MFIFMTGKKKTVSPLMSFLVRKYFITKRRQWYPLWCFFFERDRDRISLTMLVGLPGGVEGGPATLSQRAGHATPPPPPPNGGGAGWCQIRWMPRGRCALTAGGESVLSTWGSEHWRVKERRIYKCQLEWGKCNPIILCTFWNYSVQIQWAGHLGLVLSCSLKLGYIIWRKQPK